MRLGTLTSNAPSLARARRLIACSLLRISYAGERLTNAAKASIVGYVGEKEIRKEMVLAAFAGNISRAEMLLGMLPRLDVDSFMIRSPIGKAEARNRFAVSGETCA